MLTTPDFSTLLTSSAQVLGVLGHNPPEDSGQSLISAYNKAKSRLSSAEVASKLNLSDAELPLFEASLRDFTKRFDTIEGDDPERTTVISALRLFSWLETLRSRGVAITIPDFSGLPVDEDVGRKQIRALELILRSLVSERFGDDLEQQLKTIVKPELVDKWKASGDPDDLLSGTTFSELASLVVNKDEFGHYEKLYSHSAYLNYLRDRRKTIHNFLDDVRRVRNVLAHNKSISDAQLYLLELYYEELTNPIQDAFDNGETGVDPSAYLDVSREELQSYFVDLKEDIASVRDELDDFRASVEGDLGVIKEDTAVIREATAGVKSRTTMIAAGVVALLVLVGGSYLFLVGTQENTEAILVDTATIKQTTNVTNEAITDVQQSSRRIEGSLDSIQQGFETLSQSGGVIQNPERPEQFYHNARVYEGRGDYLNARRSYNEFFQFKLEVLDPYLRYSTFLKLQEGRQGAIEVFNALLEKFPTKSGEMSKILLEESATRTDLLKVFADSNPDYAPVTYFLAQQFSKITLGEQTLSDERSERRYLELFLKEENIELLPRFFVDKSFVSELQNEAEARLISQSITTEQTLPPVSISGSLSNSGWMLNVTIAEPASALLFAAKEVGPFTDNGIINYTDPRTGRPMFNPTITLPLEASAQSIYVKYIDSHDVEQGPYEIFFDPDKELLKSAKQTLQLTKQSWIAFRDYHGPILYFSHLASHSCALDKVLYSFETTALDQVYSAPCDRAAPYSVKGADISMRLESMPRFVAVKLIFKDGERSEMVKFAPKPGYTGSVIID